MEWLAGQKVSWLQQRRGGDGYPVSVAAVVTGRGQQSVRIRVAQREADGWHPAEAWVEPQSLSERTVAVPAVDGLKLEDWLRPAAGLPLECDGLTNALSALLRRERIGHRVMHGQLEVLGAGTISYHHWIELPDGRTVDFRARMWLSKVADVPHGVFQPNQRQRYRGQALEHAQHFDDGFLFQVLTGAELCSYLPAPVCFEDAERVLPWN